MSLFSSLQDDFWQELDLSYILAILQTQINLTPSKLAQIVNFYTAAWDKNFSDNSIKEKLQIQNSLYLQSNSQFFLENIKNSLLSAIKDNWQTFKINFTKIRWLKKVQMDIISFQKEVLSLQESLQKNQISLVSFWQKDYPKTLFSLDNYPLVLYYQGDINLANSKELITVVGSRNYNFYGQFLLESILKPVCQLGINVVSGLAVGIDTLAHRIALESAAKTIAIVGSGLASEVFYPKQNLNLKKQILQQGGLILSEYAPYISANIYTFPQRNRLLASLTDLTWVVQAGINSGSLITALKARDLGKTVATTAGDIRDTSLSGNLKLLKDGAVLVTESQDLLQLLGLKTFPQVQNTVVLQFSSLEEERIYKTLSLSPQNVEEIIEKTGLDLLQIQNHLSMLELSGLARHLGENNWVKNI